MFQLEQSSVSVEDTTSRIIIFVSITHSPKKTRAQHVYPIPNTLYPTANEYIDMKISYVGYVTIDNKTTVLHV